jgi:hypothetical protein
MKNTIFPITCILISAILVSSCGSSDMIWPSDTIGPMWVNRYGHTNAEFIWDHCDDTLTETPEIQITECNVPWVDELFIGYGIRAVDRSQREARFNFDCGGSGSVIFLKASIHFTM